MLLQGRRVQDRREAGMAVGGSRGSERPPKRQKAEKEGKRAVWGKFVGLLVGVLPREERMGTEDEDKGEEDKE